MNIQKTIISAFCLIGAIASAQNTATVSQPVNPANSAELQSFKQQVQAANPGMEVVSVSAVREATLAAVPNPKIAIFVKNQTKVAGMDDMVDGVRDRISAELAGAGLTVMDQAEIAAGFNRYKVTTAEERAGLIDGVFTGGSTVRVAQMLGADYVMVASIISADRMSMTVGTSRTTVFTLRMSVKINEAVQGTSVYGDNWTHKYPVEEPDAAGSDPLAFYNDLLDTWAQETGAKIASSMKTWRRAQAAPVQLVSFSVSTTIDELIKGLESGVRAPNELLDEMRHIVGGATVQIDGAAVGSSPGTYQVAPGLHQMRISRQWMKDWQQTVNIQNGSNFRIGLELSDAGMQRFQSLEHLKAQIAKDYAEAMALKGIKVNFDTAAWRDVSVGNKGSEINLEKKEIQQRGLINAAGQ
ncbi:MAG TPA: PEGA domain-containing protein [Pontiellaceae bacterium]|nr:PEGA domain-containing protein [Pontiellaceae bacterium]HPR82613.1 PEGA domain-containing protein [Pontiellaceae bacterium]